MPITLGRSALEGVLGMPEAIGLLEQDFIEARKGQENLALLRQLVKQPRLETGLKAALRAMGRDCGDPRPPSKPLGEIAQGKVPEAICCNGFSQRRAARLVRTV